MGHPLSLISKKYKEKCCFHWGSWLKIGEITVEVDIFFASCFCFHIKAGKFRGRRAAWWLCSSQRGSQCSHTSVAARRIENAAGDSDGKEKIKRETIREKEIGVGRADWANYSETVVRQFYAPPPTSLPEGTVSLLILFFRRGMSVFIFAKKIDSFVECTWFCFYLNLSDPHKMTLTFNPGYTWRDVVYSKDRNTSYCKREGGREEEEIGNEAWGKKWVKERWLK